MEIIYSIKDKLNLLNYNIWSGTDYLKNITGFTKNPTSSTEWSINGERSLKLTRVAENYNDYITEITPNLPVGNYLLTFKLYAPNTNGQITVFTNAETLTVGYAKNNNPQTISITIIDNTINMMRISIYVSLESIYLDNLSIIAQ